MFLVRLEIDFQENVKATLFVEKQTKWLLIRGEGTKKLNLKVVFFNSNVKFKKD
jgi:hypothetical protein